MSKAIGVIAEDLSDVLVINEILQKYLANSEFYIKKFIGKGCGTLRNKCDSWAKMLYNSGCQHILVFHDLDRNSETDLRRELEKKVGKKEYPNSIIIIPIQEMEAWLLSDSNAIKKVFNLNKAPKRINDCEIIQSPKEHLKRLVWELGKKRYLNTTHNQKIAKIASISNFKRCKSYKPFDEYILEKISVQKI